MKKYFLQIVAFKYRVFLRPIFFLFPSEPIHDFLTTFGSFIGETWVTRTIVSSLFRVQSKTLTQTIHGMRFDNPIGLSAGFDYRAQLTQTLPSIGFGFGTIGTITNLPYEGNQPPRLGRLPKSRSLLVNKGFKNDGVIKTLARLKNTTFSYPVGISIGRTNTKDLDTVEKCINDIVAAFTEVEHSRVPFAYYELNISCPNLLTDVSFYDTKNLKLLLTALKKLKLTKPMFIKMPINEGDQDVIRMLALIVQYPVAGVIFGNLQKDRNDPSLDLVEVKKYPVGNFSGKPTWNRSNELISLSYKKFGKKLIIVGCGGVFSAADAYEKIKRGASLVQLITGLIYQGPQLAGEINCGLIELLKQDGYSSIAQAIGTKKS